MSARVSHYGRPRERPGRLFEVPSHRAQRGGQVQVNVGNNVPSHFRSHRAQSTILQVTILFYVMCKYVIDFNCLSDYHIVP
jgi:hypothetical protein